MSQSPKIIDIPKHVDERGNLSVVDSQTCLPFELKRVFYIYDMPSDTQRGAHAHKKLHQFLWCLSGSVEVSTVNFEGRSERFTLSLPWKGLHIPPLTWAHETSLSAGCVYVVGASSFYDEDDYIREYSEFQDLISD